MALKHGSSPIPGERPWFRRASRRENSPVSAPYHAFWQRNGAFSTSRLRREGFRDGFSSYWSEASTSGL
jgi:hypothetical protein